MRTDDLVAALSANIEPVNGRPVGRTVYIALAAATVVALGISIYGRDRGRGIDLSDTAGPPRRGAKNLVNFGRYAVRGDRAACRNQPRTRAQLALEQDGYGR